MYLANGSANNTSVYFNGVRASNQSRSPDENAIQYVVPVGTTTGLITVVNDNGTVVSTAPFVVPPTFFEDFETGTKTSYIPASVPLLTCGWPLGEALIGTTAGIDKFNGTRSARLRGGGFLEMDVDKSNGAGVVTVSAATYATETGASFVPEISTDGGVTYTSLLGTAPAPTLTGTLTPYSFTANRTGNVRLRFSSTNTAGATNPRINLDDIGITDYRVGTAAQAGQSLPELRVFPNPAQGWVTVQGTGMGPARCSLYDLAGQRLLSPVVLPADGALALPPQLPTGFYLLQVETAAGRRIMRLATQ
ncbi:T9SS type A sorting domain-containing protein [Hymenobacter convexus]|uniref:T9SS type A sorting domain-containing protein n=1 Tax=Hymenobacter sp. CA1UV-4 TaxID=3063782 RepID=UPI0027143044|nr:T9SS type A sorting domain-containing protein [Hymenobacter sp. CA1UV-4]MDO7853514.1 T9SS type A sorting domain-containing protein [Hymenobacter sp. CA1UV-4]